MPSKDRVIALSNLVDAELGIPNYAPKEQFFGVALFLFFWRKKY